MLHDSVPFDNNLKLAIAFVIDEDSRPQISEDVEADVAKLIRLCWQNDIYRRPSFA